MPKSHLILLGLSVVGVLAAGDVRAQSVVVGTWTLEKAENYGAAPKGRLMFDAAGNFSLILMKSDLPKYASNRRTQGTPDEYKATTEGSLAYFGTYKVDGSELILNIDASTFPNWNGTEQRRTKLSVSGDKLEYLTPTPSGGGSPDTVVWRRSK